MSQFSFPDQTIPESKKTKEWHKNHIVSFVTYLGDSSTYRGQRQEILKYTRAYHGELDEKEQEMVKAITCPYGYNLGQDYIVYPLIRMKVEQLAGEFMQRPLKRKTYVKNRKAKNEKLAKKAAMIAEDIMRDIAKKMEPDLGFEPQTENPQMQLPEEKQELDSMEIKTIAEEVGQDLVDFFLDVRKEKQKFKQAFTQFCISYRASFTLDKKNGHTTQRLVNSLDCEHDLDPYKDVQDDHDFFFESYMQTENEIYNTYSLTYEEKQEVKGLFATLSGKVETSGEGEGDSDSIGLGTTDLEGWVDNRHNSNRIRCAKLMWKSRKRIRYAESTDNNGQKRIHKLKDGQRINKKRQTEKFIDIEVPRFVLMIGPNLVLDYGEMEHRYSFMDDKKSCRLPVVTLVGENTTGSSKIRSVAANLYPLQKMASEILFELRLALKRTGGRVLVYDTAQTPKEFTRSGFDNAVNRVMHHAKKDQMLLINSKDKATQRASGFNQFTSLDLSNKGQIQDLFGGLAFIEDLADKFIGLSPERQGQVGQYQTATGVDSAVRGSTARTEVIFNPFDDFIVAVLEKVLAKMKKDYQKGEVIHYVMGDMKTKFLKLFDEFFDCDLGLYFSDSRKEQERSRKIEEAAQLALANAQGPEMIMGLIDVFEGETASEKKAVFQRIVDSLEQVRQENRKAEQEAHQAELQAKAEAQDKADQLVREGHDKDKYVAHVYADNKMNDTNAKVNSAERIKAAELNADEAKNKES